MRRARRRPPRRGQRGRPRSSPAVSAWASSVALCCGAVEAKACESAALAQREQHDFRDHETERHEIGAPNIERIAPHCKEIFQAAPVHADPLAYSTAHSLARSRSSMMHRARIREAAML